jgi:hypothetical protein
VKGFTSVVVLLAFSVLGGFSAGLMGLMGLMGVSDSPLWIVGLEGFFRFFLLLVLTGSRWAGYGTGYVKVVFLEGEKGLG